MGKVTLIHSSRSIRQDEKLQTTATINARSNVEISRDVSCLREGFEEMHGVCHQIDECLMGRDECEYECIDSDGSYKCSCPPDQKLDENLHNCSMIVSAVY